MIEGRTVDADTGRGPRHRQETKTEGIKLHSTAELDPAGVRVPRPNDMTDNATSLVAALTSTSEQRGRRYQNESNIIQTAWRRFPAATQTRSQHPLAFSRASAGSRGAVRGRPTVTPVWISIARSRASYADFSFRP